MRILLLNYEFPPLGGGAANATLQTLKEFRISYPDIIVDVVTSSDHRERVERFSENITIYYLDIYKANSLHHQSITNLLMYSFLSYKKVKELKDQFHYNGIHAFFGIPCGYIASKMDIPYIVSLRGSDVPFYSKKYYWLDTLFFARMSKKIWRNAAAVIANSEGLKELALDLAPTQAIEVIRNGVHTEDFIPAEKLDKTFTILSASRLVERKGIRYLIDGFSLFHKKYPQSELLIAGEGGDMERLKSIAQDLGCEEYITFLGAVSHDDMKDLYRRSDVFALPSMNEGMSNSLLEAMSSGLAIVATDTGDSKYLIAECGKIVPKRNSKALCDFFVDMYTHPETLNYMQKRSRQQALRMSWSDVAKDTVRLYKKMFDR